MACKKLEKGSDRIDRKGFCYVLKVHRVGGKLYEGVRSFYVNNWAWVIYGDGVGEF